MAKHGNSTHGIRKAERTLQAGKPFDGYMQELYQDALARRSLDGPALDALGARGDVIRHTARLSVVADLVWGGLLMAAACGDVGGFYTILREHGHRLDQAIRNLHREAALETGDGAIDYEEWLANHG